VIAERQGAVGVLRLNRPAKMNALTAEVGEALMHHAEAFIADPAVRALRITGTGKAFCAGGDISAMRLDIKGPQGRDRMMAGQRRAKLLIACPKPIVTAVNGAAAGAGFAIAMLGDIVVAARSASFQTAFLGIGVVPDYGLGYTLPRAVGMPIAKDLILTNRRVGADEALSLGIVSRVYDDAVFDAETQAIAASLADGPTYAYGLAKELVGRAFDDTVESYFEREALAQSVCFASEDFVAGVEAFRGKRRPTFRGR
jgi:2-(1,2-epoxy-1,2-dihydrophenyl)acetyl-CoA isomerase